HTMASTYSAIGHPAHGRVRRGHGMRPALVRLHGRRSHGGCHRLRAAAGGGERWARRGGGCADGCEGGLVVVIDRGASLMARALGACGWAMGVGHDSRTRGGGGSRDVGEAGKRSACSAYSLELMHL